MKADRRAFSQSMSLSRDRWNSSIVAPASSTSYVEQTDHCAVGFVPGADGLAGRQHVHPAAVAFEITGRLVGKLQHALLPGADDQPLCALLVDVLGFVQRDEVGCAVDRLG